MLIVWECAFDLLLLSYSLFTFKDSQTWHACGVFNYETLNVCRLRVNNSGSSLSAIIHKLLGLCFIEKLHIFKFLCVYFKLPSRKKIGSVVNLQLSVFIPLH